MFPNKILQKVSKAAVAEREWVPPCIACQNGKLRCGYSPDLLAILQGNPGRPTPDFASVAYTCCACYSPFPMLASAISLNGNRRQPPPCLPKSETDGRLSMAAQPFILTIDGVRPFCYSDYNFE